MPSKQRKRKLFLSAYKAGSDYLEETGVRLNKANKRTMKPQN